MDFLNGSFPLFRFAGISVRIHILFILFIGMRLLDGRGNFESELIFLTMLFGVVLLHEFGHCFGARAVGGDAENILLWPLGGLAYANAPMTPWAQFVTVACGPLVNVVFFLATAAILIFATGDWNVIGWNPFGDWGARYITADWQRWPAIFFQINYMLFLFNMLPFFPMDGGQLFRTFIWPFFGLRQSTIYAAQLGLAGAALFGVWGLTQGRTMLVVMALFGGMTCWQHLRAAQYGYVVEDYSPSEPTRRRRGGFWSRLFGGAGRSVPPGSRPMENPNPGGWERRLDEEEQIEAEVDRILKKVSEQGVQSLTYVERQTLERARQAQLRRDR